MGHLFRKFPPFQGVQVAIGPQMCGILPRWMARRGEIAALLGPCCHLDPLQRGELPEKVPKKGVPPTLGTLWRFRGFPGQNGGLRECKPAEKTVHHPSGVISEVLPRVNLGLRHAGSAKLTLGRTSEMTPEGWCTVFSAGLDSLTCLAHSFHREIPKIAKKCTK